MIKEKRRESKDSLNSPYKSDKKKLRKDFKRKKSSIKIKSMNASINKTRSSLGPQEIIPVTITINLSNLHFLDSSFYSKELDMKLGVIQLSKNIPKEKDNFNDTEQSKMGESSKMNIPIISNEILNLNQIINNVFNGKQPVLAINSDFQIGFSLVYDLYLEEGTYIIVPMTMGYCMQSNPKIAYKKYVIGDDKNDLPLKKTAISKFLDDLLVYSF